MVPNRFIRQPTGFWEFLFILGIFILVVSIMIGFFLGAVWTLVYVITSAVHAAWVM